MIEALGVHVYNLCILYILYIMPTVVRGRRGGSVYTLASERTCIKYDMCVYL